MVARKCPARRNRLGVNVGNQLFGKRHHFAVRAILFDLRAGDQREFLARVDRADYFIERRRFR